MARIPNSQMYGEGTSPQTTTIRAPFPQKEARKGSTRSVAALLGGTEQTHSLSVPIHGSANILQFDVLVPHKSPCTQVPAGMTSPSRNTNEMKRARPGTVTGQKHGKGTEGDSRGVHLQSSSKIHHRLGMLSSQGIVVGDHTTCLWTELHPGQSTRVLMSSVFQF